MNKIITNINILITFTILISSYLVSQNNNSLSGKIYDKKTGEELIGATVLLTNTQLGASADVDGKYLVKQIPEGIYSVRISFIGYETKIIFNLEIKNSTNKILDIGLSEENGIQQEEVVVSATAIRSGEGAILSERKKSITIGDAIGLQQIKKSPDATSSDALKRVPGVNIVDNKFIYIRGVTDRYNQTTLNGTAVSSTSVDKKSFSFDMLPANLIDNITVTKTATADLSGDFTGGLVQVNTLDIPDQLSVKFTDGISYNSLTTSNNFQESQSNNSSWMGYDSKSYAFPNSTLSNSEVAQALPNNWSTNNIKAPLAQSFNASFGTNIDIDEDKLGIISAVSYRNSLQHVVTSMTEFGNTKLIRQMSGFSDKSTILLGGIFDVSYNVGGLHKLNFKNNFNRVVEDKVYELFGTNEDNDEYIKSFQIEMEKRDIYSVQLGGEHFLPEFFKTNIDWILFNSEGKTEQPDRKELTYGLSRAYSDADPFIAKPGERSWGNIYERNRGLKFNFTLPVEMGKFKAGFLIQDRKKNYEMKYYQIYSNYLSPENFNLLLLPKEEIYDKNNFGSGKFILLPFTSSSGSYDANQNLSSFYILSDLTFNLFGLTTRVNNGVRLENSEQLVETKQGRLGTNSISSTINVADILPSINLAFIIQENQNIKLAYSHTVNRPEFREMSDMYYYDFDKSEYVHGNSSLQRALIQNIDFRYEIFPDIGEVFAFGYFYKKFTNPIEEFKTFNSFTERTWVNAPKGVNNGWELEARKNLGFISSYFNSSEIVFNYTRVYSYIPYKENTGNSVEAIYLEGNRPMQGQSPYTFNISLFFTEPNLETSINILYNEYGSRIDAIGDVKSGDGDIYEQKRGTLDFTISQPILFVANKLEAKFSAKNITNQPITFTQGTSLYRKNNVGVNYSFQLSYSL